MEKIKEVNKNPIIKKTKDKSLEILFDKAHTFLRVWEKILDVHYIRPTTRFLRNNGHKNMIGVEIGVQYGFNSKNLLENLSIDKLYMIDPYSPYQINAALVSVEQQKHIYDSAVDLLKPFGSKAEFVRELSENAVDKIPDDLDFVYIDGDHSYSSVKKDIGLYYPKVADGGVIGGHDFKVVNIGVMRAVTEFVDKHKIFPYLEYPDWWIVK